MGWPAPSLQWVLGRARAVGCEQGTRSGSAPRYSDPGCWALVDEEAATAADRDALREDLETCEERHKLLLRAQLEPHLGLAIRLGREEGGWLGSEVFPSWESMGVC